MILETSKILAPHLVFGTSPGRHESQFRMEKDLWAKGMQARGFRWGIVQRKSLSSFWCHVTTKFRRYEWYLPFIALMIHSPLKQPGSHGMLAGLCGPLGLCQCFTSWRLGAAVGTLRWDLGIITAAGFDACGAGTRTHMATATKWHLCRWADSTVRGS